MNPTLPLDGRIYTLTVGRVPISDQSRIAFVQSHSQSQARLMFVNCSQNGQLGLYQNQCTFQKIHSLSMGGAHSRLLAHIASPTSPPYVGTQLTALFHTQPLLT